MEVTRASTHGDKLKAILNNRSLPDLDRERVEKTVVEYNKWKSTLASATGTPTEILIQLVDALNAYKRHVELELIFDSDSDFLHRQKGQTKLDNTVLEEFLPYLFDVRLIPGLGRIQNLRCGPQKSFAGLSFESPLLPLNSGAVNLKDKNQDFAVAKAHKIVISDDPASDVQYSERFVVSHFATEIKTNLDKTMFQEASQTAAELKRAVPGSRYILLCEYLDMKPINTKLTSIDEVIVLRKAKRLGSNVRSAFSTAGGRLAAREKHVEFLDKNLLKIECFERFLWHLREIFPDKLEEAEDVILERGYF